MIIVLSIFPHLFTLKTPAVTDPKMIYYTTVTCLGMYDPAEQTAEQR